MGTLKCGVLQRAYLVLTHVSQILRWKSGISKDGEVEAAAKSFTTKMGALLARKHATALEISPGLDAKKAMPGHFLHFISALYDYYSLYEMSWHTSLSMC